MHRRSSHLRSGRSAFAVRRARRALIGALGLAGATALVACSGWSPLDPFEHNSPAVDEAIVSMDAGQYKSAEELLEEYLKTGACGDAGIGLPDDVRLKSNGSFDLGLTLFRLAEKYGHRFGDEESDASTPEERAGARAAEVGCALAIVKVIAQDPKVPLELRARAFFLAGNLEFMQRKYKDAVELYDQALGIVPGLPADAGADGIGRDAAHNRAIALRRLEDQDDAGEDASDQQNDGGGGDGGDAGDSGSGGQDASDDGGGKKDGGADGGDDDDDNQNPESQGPDAGDAGRDAGADGSPDAGGDAGRDQGSPNDDQGDASAPKTPQPGEPQQGSQQDDRMLDRLEEAPSYQQQEARVRGNRHRRTMEDK